ncbi:hypothetical protein AMECASPLE_029000, partial [Ameca splendens]
MQKDGYDSQPDKEDETKTRFKDRMKNFPRTSILSGRGSLGKSSKAKQSHQTEDSVSPSSSSDEDESEKKRKQRQVNIKKKIASLFKKNLKVSKEQNDSHPQRPSDLPSGKKRGQGKSVVVSSSFRRKSHKTSKTDVALFNIFLRIINRIILYLL